MGACYVLLVTFVSICELRVRSYELDSYGHVNNAVYVQWLEHGRSRLLQDKGFDYHNIARHWNVRFVTASLKLDYEKQLDLGDEVAVRTWVGRFGRTSVTLLQEIWRKDVRAARAEVVVVFTNPEMTEAVPIPDAFRALYG